MNKKWWEKLPTPKPVDELKYYQTEKKVITVQLIALNNVDIAECFNYVVFDGKLGVFDIIQGYQAEDMIQTMTTTKDYLIRTKNWLEIVRIRR